MKPMRASAVGKLEDLHYPMYASAKLDGIRCLIVNGVAMSRTLKPIPNKYVQSILGKPEFNGLDGELIVGSGTESLVFSETTSGIMSEQGEPNFKYLVFDQWDRDVAYSAMTWDKYHDASKGIGRISILPQLVVHGPGQVEAMMDKAMSLGYEGLMLRKPLSPYKFGDSTLKEEYLLKYKRFIDAEAVITGFKEEMGNTNALETDALGHAKRSSHKAGKKPKGTLAGYLVTGKDGRFNGVDFKVGLDCTQERQKELWDRRDNDLGRIIRYKYQEAGSKDRPRFPGFDGYSFRED